MWADIKRSESINKEIVTNHGTDVGFPAGLVVKLCLPMKEMQVQSLGREDLLEKGMATHSCILAGEIPWTEEPSGLQSVGS